MWGGWGHGLRMFLLLTYVCRGLKPGQETLDAVGGAHKLQGWKGNLLTGMFVSFDFLWGVEAGGFRFYLVDRWYGRFLLTLFS